MLLFKSGPDKQEITQEVNSFLVPTHTLDHVLRL
jgi:hypothetical protein